MVRVTVATPIRPTEDATKVEAALHRFFPDADVQRAPDGLKATTSDLLPFRSRVWELFIIDTVRGQLLHGMAADGLSLSFRLSKQAAAAGKVSFPPTPHPLGDLEVRIEVEPGDPWPALEPLVWWICPETKDGAIVGPI
ncbi:MAG: RNA-binding domain-containing protein [Candidatus Thermoplasmatota archaeon]